MYVPYFINDIHLVYSHTDTALTFHNAFKWSGLCFVQFTEACAPTQRVQLSSNFKKKSFWLHYYHLPFIQVKERNEVIGLMSKVF